MVRSTQMWLIATLLLAAGAAAQSPAPAERARVTHLLQRATWGVRPADVDAVMAMGIGKWLDRQLDPSRIDDAAAAERLKLYPSVQRDMTDAVTEFQRQQRLRQQAARQGARPDSMDAPDAARRRAAAGMRGDSAMMTAPPRQGANNPQLLMLDLSSARIARAVYTERQLEDVMTDFWYNHFNVYFGKGIDRYMVADYEATAIRPHVFGRFRDMLGATAKHPAMLFYLDNAMSVAANAPGPRGRGRGLNENYARELLELHTLGVDGGYTQQDIINVARAFTGWSFSRPGPRGGARIAFEFRRVQHDRDEKVVLGRQLPAGRGLEDGEAVLDLLARHPSTARHIARKLAERFVIDKPDSAFVDELAAVFTRTNGDLRAVTRALFTSKHFYDPSVYRAKVKTPFELVTSALRVTGAEVSRSRTMLQTLRTLGHLPYNAPDPTGYPSASEDWVNSGAMVNRMNFAIALGGGRLDGVRIDPRVLTSNTDVRDANDFVPVLLQRLIPGAGTEKLESTILRELAKAAEPVTDRDVRPAAALARQNAARALGLALGSPEFQRK